VAEVRSEAARAILMNALQSLEESSGHVTLEFGRWHGDWVPWNMIATASNLRLWDWEHVEDDVPIGFDVLHYRAQQLRNASQPTALSRAEQVWLNEAPALLTHMGLQPSQAACTVSCYLVKINTRYLRETQRGPAPAELEMVGGFPYSSAKSRRCAIPSVPGTSRLVPHNGASRLAEWFSSLAGSVSVPTASLRARWSRAGCGRRRQ
jgi:hypothetical protein